MKNQCRVLALALISCLLKVYCIYESQMPQTFRLSPAGINQFQPILLSPGGDFVLGFYRVGKDQFLLSVVFVLENDVTNVNATEIVWSANPNSTVNKNSKFVQDGGGSISLLDDRGSILWQVAAPPPAEVVLLDSGNLQVKTLGEIKWQSFDNPTDTLLEAQNLTAGMVLTAARGNYSLQMEAAGMALTWRYGQQQVYWRRKAMQEKALIDVQKGPIYARLESDGYIAMYQSESALVDVIPLDTYHQKLSVRRRLKLEDDGNLRAYYWNDQKREWDVDFQAVESPCDLPSTCGSYATCGLNTSGAAVCNCMTTGAATGCMERQESALFCTQNTTFVRLSGLDLPYSEFAAFVYSASEQSCMDLCGGTCGCAAALFYNASKRCYKVPVPLPTLVQQATQDKVVFVKFLNTTDNGRRSRCRSSECKAVLILASVGLAVGALAAVVSFWRRKLQEEGKRENCIALSQNFMPYNNLKQDEAAHG